MLIVNMIILMNNNVHWLSRVISLKRFVYYFNEIRLFLYEYNNTDFKGLGDSEWLTKLMFFTSTTLHLNILNKSCKEMGRQLKSLLD